MERKTFWTASRRRLIAKTLSNLFLLLIGAAATGDVVVGLSRDLKVLVGGVIFSAGVAAVLVMPEDDKGDE